MNKIIISVFAQDRPGIVAAVSKALLKHECNIENISQTILQHQFAGIFITSVPSDVQIDQLHDYLKQCMQPLNIDVHVKSMDYQEPLPISKSSEPFVISAVGADSKGLVAGLTEIFARYRVNVTNLKAVFKGGDDPSHNIMIYEVDIPDDIDQNNFVRDLRKRAENLGLDISIQHRKIFEMMNKI
ncbi:MAG: ACT domain-containing protein [Desulfobacterales bacterium]|nr:ACT domain-containing protein [Desulfobacterales bacterium]MDD4072549.1 ACT domain-containing protein [Desulfobacterales bacterium]MDD4393818.1 ACT domain-containing protein [Desulfobacterales bacterium]